MSSASSAGPVTRFEDLIAWQKARAFTSRISELVDQPPLASKFSFKDQLHRATVSVMSNIAEGFERGSRAEFHHMLSIAKGSNAEIRSLLYVAADAGYISRAMFDSLMQDAEEVGRIVGALRITVGRQRDAARSR
jgi:four helix bundle protein